MYLGPQVKTCTPFAMKTWVRLIFPKTHPDIAQHMAGEGWVWAALRAAGKVGTYSQGTTE